MKHLSYFLAIATMTNVAFAAPGNEDWSTPADKISACSPSTFSLPNLSQISFLQAAINSAATPELKTKINSYFTDATNTITISGWQNDQCVLKFQTQSANAPVKEFQCSYSKANLAVISQMAQQLASDHSGLTAATSLLDAINSTKQSCK